MRPGENNSENGSAVRAYLEEQSALVRSGGYWNCLTAARKLSALLLAESRSPWIARLRKTQALGEHVFHGPLITRVPGIGATWTTHYVCCCDALAYDPLAGKAMPLEDYSREIFGEQIPLEVFVPAEDLPAYLAKHTLTQAAPRFSRQHENGEPGDEPADNRN
jgi:hypothetical protein